MIFVPSALIIFSRLPPTGWQLTVWSGLEVPSPDEDGRPRAARPYHPYPEQSGSVESGKSSGRSVRGEVNPLKKYEIVFVLHADEPESEMEARVQSIETMVQETGGEIAERNHWGVRQLAFEIQHETRGNYMHLRFRSEGSAIDKMDKEFRLDHKVLRHLVVVDEEWKERNEANKAKRRAAASAAANKAHAIPQAAPAPAGDK